MSTGERQRPLGKGMRFLQAAGQQLRLLQGEMTEHRRAYHFHRSAPLHRLCEQWHGLGDAPGQDIRRTQGPGHLGEKDREVHVLTDTHGPFEPGERPGQDNLAEALAAPRPVEERHGLPQTVDGLPILALGLLGCAEVEVRHRVQNTIPTARGEREGALSGGNGMLIRTHAVEIV
jgi:hypothetical protein